MKYLIITLLMVFPLAEVASGNVACDNCIKTYEDCIDDNLDSTEQTWLRCPSERKNCLINSGCECLAYELDCGHRCTFDPNFENCIKICMKEHAPECEYPTEPDTVCEGKYAKIKVSNANLILNAFGGTSTDAFIGLYANNDHDNAKFTIIPVGNNVIFRAKKNWNWDPELTMHAYGGSKADNFIRLHGDVNYAKQHANSLFKLIKYNDKYIIKVSDQDLTMHAYGGSKSGSYNRLHGGVEYAKQHANSQFTFECVD